MAENNIKKNRNMVNSKYTLMIVKITLCVFVVLNLLLGRISYDLFLIYLIILLTENIQLFKSLKQKEDLIAIIAIILAIIGISILYIGESLHFK